MFNVPPPFLNLIRKRGGRIRKRNMEMERDDDKGSQRIQIFGIHVSEEWQTEGAYKGEGKEGNSGNEASMEEEKVWKELREKKICLF